MKRLGSQTVKFATPPYILTTASIVGKKEGEGPLAQYFDQILDDEYWGEKSFEKAETKILRETINLALSKSNKTAGDMHYIFAGDLLNQCISSSSAIKDSNIPFFGLFGACSTMTESMSLGAMLVDGGFADNLICATSSHFCSAERQFRLPLEQGGQRPPSAQWTVTGSGAAILSNSGSGPRITHVTTGKIVEMGIKDANNMGAAMAPAAVDTISAHFSDTGRNADYYDLIITGDLGEVGMEIASEMLEELGTSITDKYNDCGVMIFDSDKQDTHSGGSGCGCCASVFSGYIYRELLEKRLNRVLLLATGALMSPTSIQQGDAIGGIAHAIAIENLE